MLIDKVALEATGHFSPLFLDYIKGLQKLEKFSAQPPTLEGCERALSARLNFSPDRRRLLLRVVQSQYAHLSSIPAPVQANISAIGDSNTYTVTTGHQLNLFTGPLYFIYKILTIVKLSERLAVAFPDQHFVPIYWMATEDHDLEEIRNVNIFNNKYTWQTEQSGPVGRMDPSTIHSDIIENLPFNMEIFERAYREKTLADACRYYVNALFGHLGVVVFDGDHPEFKRSFAQYIHADIFDGITEIKVNRQSEMLESLGYDKQIHCRPINCFWLEDGLRARIAKEDEHYSVVGTEMLFTPQSLKQQLINHPEKFSPNVALRPLYQEHLLPNIAYIGGPSEITYWLQLKTLFDHHCLPFPVLIPRNFGLVMTSNELMKWRQQHLSWEDLFLPIHSLETSWVQQHPSFDLDLNSYTQSIIRQYQQLEEKFSHVDPTLGPHIDALRQQTVNRLAKAEKKLMRAEKRHHQDSLRQLRDVKRSLFPQGHLQERHTNFLNFFRDDSSLIDHFHQQFDPFDFRFHLIQHGR